MISFVGAGMTELKACNCYLHLEAEDAYDNDMTCLFRIKICVQSHCLVEGLIGHDFTLCYIIIINVFFVPDYV